MLQADAVLLTILLRVQVAVPAALLELCSRIDCGIGVGHFLRSQSDAQYNQAIEGEEVDFSVGRLPFSDSMLSLILRNIVVESLVKQLKLFFQHIGRIDVIVFELIAES